jgi:exoribonuclease R
VRCLGPIGDLTVEEQAVLTDNNITDTPFSALVMNHLDEIPRTIAAVEIEKRRDLRNELVFTIDPHAAKGNKKKVYIQRY